MVEIINATWQDLQFVVESAQRELTICTPYYGTDGVYQIFDHLQETANLVFITRLSPIDWLHGVSDPDALATLLGVIQEDTRNTRLWIHQRLHAKAYLADELVGLLGSANLSTGGFSTNFELMVRLDSEGVSKAHTIIENEVQHNGREIAVADLNSWVDQYRDQIRILQRTENNEAEQLAEIQRDLDTILGFGNNNPPTSGRIYEMGKFVEWLQDNQGLAGANMLLDRHFNTSGQNLTGHFRQSYYAVAHFLNENQATINDLDDEIALLDPDEIFQPQDRLLELWVQHLDTHATDLGDGYDYAVLRGILPPNLGGTRQGGGGGSSTLKRMLPLVARFTVEHGV